MKISVKQHETEQKQRKNSVKTNLREMQLEIGAASVCTFHKLHLL